MRILRRFRSALDETRAAWIIAVGIGLVAAPLVAVAVEAPAETADAEWIWDAGEAHPKNYFLMVRRSFLLPSPPDAAALHITASDRYVLYVNGDYVGRGPARSDPRFKSYDTYQIGEKLKSGKNAVAVLAYHYGQNTSPSGPYLGNAFAAGDRAGLWAKLQVTSGSQTTVVPTGSDWLVTPALGWKRDVPPVNPLVGFPEWYDARRDPVDWTQPGFDDTGWQPATVIPAGERPWKSLEARDVPMMRQTEVFPVRITKTGEVAESAEEHIHKRFMEEVQVPLEHAVLEGPEFLLADDGRTARAQAKATPSGEVREPFVIIDFGRQVFGFPKIKMTAPEGAVIDMITSPHLVEGRIATGAMHLGSRYVARAGEQTWQHFEYRQFRYLEIAVRSGEAVEIESVSLNAYEYPAERRGRFACSDPVLTKLWTACVDTAYLQMEDVLAIDAWRERVNWISCDIMDAIVAGFGDTAVVRRHFRMIGRTDFGDGLLAVFVPPRHVPTRVIPQHLLIWLYQVKWYYDCVGDHDFLAELYPAVKGQMDWFDQIVDQDGLITDTPYWNWFDWSSMDKRGTCFATNAIYLRALEVCAEMADIVDDSVSARRWREKAANVRRRLRGRFWNDERGLFEDAFVKGKFTGSFSEMANGLALGCDIATEDQVPRILSQFHAETPQGIAKPTPIWFGMILSGLIRVDHLEKALELTRHRYGHMIAGEEAPTIWELWTPSSGGTRSLVHGGNAPAFILSQEVLGIKSVGPGFKECRIEVPDLESIDWAEGVFPSVRGDIGVEWRKEGRQLAVDVDLPAGLKTTIAVAPDTQGRAVTLDGKPVSAADLVVVGGRHQVLVK